MKLGRDRICCVFFSSRAVPGGMDDWGRRQQPTPPALLDQAAPVRILCMADTAAKHSNRGEVPFEVTLADLPEPPIYQKIFEIALHLNQLGMNPNRIAFHLGVDRTTIVRSLRWKIGSIPGNP